MLRISTLHWLCVDHFQKVENIVDLKQSRLSTHSQCSVKILNIVQMAIISQNYIFRFYRHLHVHLYAQDSLIGKVCCTPEHVDYKLNTLY